MCVCGGEYLLLCSSVHRRWTSGKCWWWTTSTQSVAICCTSCWAGDFLPWSSLFRSSSCSADTDGRSTACTDWCEETCECHSVWAQREPTRIRICRVLKQSGSVKTNAVEAQMNFPEGSSKANTANARVGNVVSGGGLPNQMNGCVWETHVFTYKRWRKMCLGEVTLWVCIWTSPLKRILLYNSPLCYS